MGETSAAVRMRDGLDTLPTDSTARPEMTRER